MHGMKIPDLNHVLIQLVFRRLFLPLLIVGLVTIVGVGYLWIQTIGSQQRQNIKDEALLVERYLDHGGRILDAIARIAENDSVADVTVFMQSTWEAYQNFDTIYVLDGNHKVEYMVPHDRNYLGLDMSNIPDFQGITEQQGIAISRPFISLRTGVPTVYLIRPLSQGRCVVGELNLGVLQNEIIQGKEDTKQNITYILDQFGMLLAHPDEKLVKQRANWGHLDIFNSGLTGDVALLYKDQGTWVYGNATKVGRVGWMIVDQVPLSILLGPYVLTSGVVLIVMISIWLALAWFLRRQIESHIVDPLVQLGQGTKALAIGDYSKVSMLTSMDVAFSELDQLASDFLRMSDTLESRQGALIESEERYRGLFERVPIGLFRFAADGTLLAVNQANINIFGFPDRDTMMQENVLSFSMTLKDQKRWELTVAAGQGEYVEMPMRRYDSTVIWVRTRCLIERGKEGEILFYNGSIEDITAKRNADDALLTAYEKLETRVAERTALLAQANQLLQTEIVERKRAEEFIRASKERFEALVKQSSEAVVVYDLATFTIVEVNPACVKMFGYSEEEFLSMTLQDLACYSKEEVDRLVLLLKETGGFPTATTTYRHKTGKPLYAERTGSLINHMGQDLVLVSHHDLTAEQKLQDKIQAEVNLAGMVQRSLLAGDYADDRLIVQTIFQPVHLVSGDFYGYKWSRDMQIFNGYLLDVTGHGMATALQTSAISTILNEVMKQGGFWTKEALGQINRRLQAYLTEETFAAIMVFSLDFSKGILTCISGGISCFFASTRKQSGRIVTPGSFLGISETGDFGITTLAVQPGDTLYFVTDGIIEQAVPIGQLTLYDFDMSMSILKQAANNKAKWDDCSAICIKITGPSSQPIYFEGDKKEDRQRIVMQAITTIRELVGVRGCAAEIAVVEGINNAFLYGKNVCVKIRKIGQFLVIRISDTGSGFPGNQMIANICASGIGEKFEAILMEDRGRGLPLMVSFMDRVIYNRKGNQVLLAKKL